MPFNPALPVENSEMKSAEMRDQFNGLKELIDAIPPAPPTPALNAVLAAGNDAGGVNLTGLRNLAYSNSTFANLDLFMLGAKLSSAGGASAATIEVMPTSIVFSMGGAAKLVISNTGFSPTLPISDPHIVGALWNSAGTVKVSAG